MYIKYLKLIFIATIFTCFIVTSVYADEGDLLTQYNLADNSTGGTDDMILSSDDNTSDNNEELSEIITHEYFYDVSINHYAYESIKNLYDINAINYREEHKFQPDALISRAEFIHMLLKVINIEPMDNNTPVFDDVKQDDFYAPFIDTAYRLGITDGAGNNLFQPGNPVKRDALIKMLVTATGKLNVKWSLSWTEMNSLLSNYNDKELLSDFNNWSAHYISYGLKHNLINGYTDKTIRPFQNTTRAEAAVILNRLFISKNAENNNNDVKAASINEYPFDFIDKKTMNATMYNSNEPRLTDYTASGLKTRVGVVAVDKNVIPLGTHLYIEGYGYAVAADTGGAIKGDKIDLYAATVKEANLFGRQNVVVYILPPRNPF